MTSKPNAVTAIIFFMVVSFSWICLAHKTPNSVGAFPATEIRALIIVDQARLRPHPRKCYGPGSNLG